MKSTRTFTKVPRLLAAAAVMSTVALGAMVATTTPAFADATLTGVTMSVSNNAASEAGTTNPATYSWNFTTGTTYTSGQLTQLNLTVPSGTTLTPGSVTILGLTGCTSTTPSIDSATPANVTVPLTGCGAIASGTPAYISIPGFENSTTGGDAFRSVVTTESAPSTPIETGTAAAVNFANNNNSTSVTVVVPESLTFTNNNTALTLVPVPGVVQNATPVQLGVSTNATGGYTLSGCVTDSSPDNQIAYGSNVIGQASTSTPEALTGTLFGAQAAVGGSAHLAGVWSSALTGSEYLGYSATCGTSTTSSQEIAYDGGPASSDTLTLTNGVSVSSTQTAGTYTGTITYQVTPSY